MKRLRAIFDVCGSDVVLIVDDSAYKTPGDFIKMIMENFDKGTEFVSLMGTEYAVSIRRSEVRSIVVSEVEE